jgi:hypothetical protein
MTTPSSPSSPSPSVFTSVPPRRSLFRDYSFGWVLLLLFVASLFGQYLTQLAEFRNQAQALAEPFLWNEFWPAFGSSVFENWQSEWAQLLVQVAGLKWLLFRGSAQSKETEDRIEKIVRDLNIKVTALLDSLTPAPNIHPPRPSRPRFDPDNPA